MEHGIQPHRYRYQVILLSDLSNGVTSKNGDAIVMTDKQPDTPDISKLAQKTIDYLYTIDGEIEPELAQAIAMLRQIINEEFIARNKLVSSQLIYDLIYQKFRQFYLSKALEAVKEFHTEQGHFLCGSYKSDPCDCGLEEALVSAFKGK